jgi:hypothetical protein
MDRKILPLMSALGLVFGLVSYPAWPQGAQVVVVEPDAAPIGPAAASSNLQVISGFDLRLARQVASVAPPSTRARPRVPSRWRILSPEWDTPARCSPPKNLSFSKSGCSRRLSEHACERCGLSTRFL